MLITWSAIPLAIPGRELSVAQTGYWVTCSSKPEVEGIVFLLWFFHALFRIKVEVLKLVQSTSAVNVSHIDWDRIIA